MVNELEMIMADKLTKSDNLSIEFLFIYEVWGRWQLVWLSHIVFAMHGHRHYPPILLDISNPL